VSRKRWGLVALVCCLPALLATMSRAQSPADPALVVGQVSLRVEQSTPEQRRLDVGLAIFDPGIPLNEASHSMLGIFPEIRKAEAQFMPVLLRQVLLAG